MGVDGEPICCDASMDEVLLDLRFKEVDVGDRAYNHAPAGPVQNGWMQKPVIAAFEKTISKMEMKKEKIDALQREKKAAIAREDYLTAQKCKEEIDRLVKEKKEMEAPAIFGRRTSGPSGDRGAIGSLSPPSKRGSPSRQASPSRRQWRCHSSAQPVHSQRSTSTILVNTSADGLDALVPGSLTASSTSGAIPAPPVQSCTGARGYASAGGHGTSSPLKAEPPRKMVQSKGPVRGGA